GTALLFWGDMTGHLLLGWGLAVIVEAAPWTRLRWNFNDAACIRAWHLCLIAGLLTIAFLWIDGNSYMTVPLLLGWLPPLLLPLQFVQSFSLRASIPASTFSFFTKAQRELNHRHGLDHAAGHFNFGYVYLITVMVAATPLGARPESLLFLPGLVILMLWALLGTGRCRRSQVSLLLVVAGGIGVLGQIGLAKAYHWLNQGFLAGSADFFSPNHYRTAIGRFGEIKQSARIVWRVRPASHSPTPSHLRCTCYNRYRAGLWNNITPPDSTTTDADFKPLIPLKVDGASLFHPLRPDTGLRAIRAGLPRFALRGAAAANSPLPLPGNAASLSGFDADALECNSLGTVRIYPRQPVVSGTVIWNDAANPETPPWPETDLVVDASERAALHQVLTELRFADQTTLAAKLEVLREFFSGFQYTRYNTIKPPPIGSLNQPSAISVFLTNSRRGHCEYFATAACLLLREAGIPTRYAIGYAVMELDAKRDEWVIRGLHGHAWTRVWDERAKLWIDFDPTPAGWLGAETRSGTWTRNLLDSFQRLREDFALWRGRSRNRALVSTILLGLGGSGLVFMLQRLWHSKHTLGAASARRMAAAAGLITPLHHLEHPASKLLPPRLPGQPFGQWLSGLRPFVSAPQTLDEAIRLHQRLRFDPAPPTPPDTARLAALTKSLKAALKSR
ncbi:MAG: transglutaminase-like domain-containing protein, partial [Verrucomicrobiota bacterium]